MAVSQAVLELVKQCLIGKGRDGNAICHPLQRVSQLDEMPVCQDVPMQAGKPPGDAPLGGVVIMLQTLGSASKSQTRETPKVSFVPRGRSGLGF